MSLTLDQYERILNIQASNLPTRMCGTFGFIPFILVSTQWVYWRVERLVVVVRS